MLLVVLPFKVHLSYRDQETAKGPYLSLSQTATCCYQSNHSNTEAIPLSVLAKGTTSELVGLSSHYSLMLER